MAQDRQRRTYVLAYRPKRVVEAERRLGFRLLLTGTPLRVRNSCESWERSKDLDECKFIQLLRFSFLVSIMISILISNH